MAFNSRCWGCRPVSPAITDHIMGDEDGGEFDPVLTWDLPYDAKLIAWSVDRLIPSSNEVCVIPFSRDAAPTRPSGSNFIVETPRGIWGAWLLKNDKVYAAIALPSTDQAMETLCEDAVAAQGSVIGVLPDAVNVVKVPPCCCLENSAVAAISNLNWLMSSKKRAHPGPLEYIKQRERDYNEYNKEQGREQISRCV